MIGIAVVLIVLIVIIAVLIIHANFRSLENFTLKVGVGGGVWNFQKWGGVTQNGELFLKWGVLTPLRTMFKPSVISGDFNLNLIKYTQNRGVNQFLENILSNNFIPHVTLPNHFD